MRPDLKSTVPLKRGGCNCIFILEQVRPEKLAIKFISSHDLINKTII